MDTTTVEEARARLAQAGWAAEERVVPGAQAWEWLVVARRGERKIEARAATQLEAWARACQQLEPEAVPQTT
jgi:hypothetical protein